MHNIEDITKTLNSVTQGRCHRNNKLLHSKNLKINLLAKYKKVNMADSLTDSSLSHLDCRKVSGVTLHIDANFNNLQRHEIHSFTCVLLASLVILNSNF